MLLLFFHVVIDVLSTHGLTFYIMNWTSWLLFIISLQKNALSASQLISTEINAKSKFCL